MGLEDANPREELKQIEERIKAATQLSELKPLYFHLNEVISRFAGDFDVWVAGNDLKQLLVARGNLIQQGEIALGQPAPPAAPPLPPLASSLPDTSPAPPAPVEAVAIPEPPPPPASSLFDFAAPVQPPPPPAGKPEPPPPLASSVFDFGPPGQPPPPSAGKPESWSPLPTAVPAPPPANPPKLPPAPRLVAARPPVKPPAKRKGKSVLLIGLIAALAAVAVIVFVVVHQIQTRGTKTTAHNLASVQVEIATVPPGASVRVVPGKAAPGGGHELTCTSNCKLALAPGAYQVSASLDGYDPAAGSVTVTAEHPAAAVSFALQPQGQSVRLLTDLAKGQVTVDSQPPVDLQEGQLVLDKMAPGTHTVKVAGPNGDASFSFQIEDARMPVVTGPVGARNMVAVVVASFGNQARVLTNAGPWKLAVNGKPQSDTTPAGTDLTSFQPGLNEIVLGEGKDQRTLSENFGSAPALTAFLKTDVNAGTLIVSTGMDDVHVFLNDKENRQLTKRGQLRLQTLGKVTVRVAKSGFLDAPPQTAEVKKGAELRLQFELKMQPQFGSLGVHGAAPGTEVWVDQTNAGVVGPDGSLSFGNIQPGEHTIELRREQYLTKRTQRSFVAGREVELGGVEVVLSAANGTIRLIRNPASATVTYHRGDESESHEAHGAVIELPAGTYAFTAAAPGFAEASARVQLAPGENRELDFVLAHERPVVPPPPAVKGMADFADAASWTKDGDNWIHKGGGFVPYKLPAKGTFTFTVQLLKGGGVFRTGAVRWCVQYLDSKDYLLTEVDRKYFWTGVVKKGERLERVKTPHSLGNQKAFSVRIEVSPDRLVQSVLIGSQWKVLDTFSEPGRDFTEGKFGFLIQGSDEIAISDFKFTPK